MVVTIKHKPNNCLFFVLISGGLEYPVKYCENIVRLQRLNELPSGFKLIEINEE